MSLGWIVAGSALIGMVGVGTFGLGTLVAPELGRAFGTTVEQMSEQQRLVNYYNQQQAYYQYSGEHNQPGRHHNRHGYGYYR